MITNQSRSARRPLSLAAQYFGDNTLFKLEGNQYIYDEKDSKHARKKFE